MKIYNKKDAIHSTFMWSDKVYLIPVKETLNNSPNTST